MKYIVFPLYMRLYKMLLSKRELSHSLFHIYVITYFHILLNMLGDCGRHCFCYLKVTTLIIGKNTEEKASVFFCLCVCVRGYVSGCILSLQNVMKRQNIFNQISVVILSNTLLIHLPFY